MSDSRFPRRVFGEGEEPDARFTLANERTFLAWVRTALALLAGAVAVHAPGVGLDGWVRTAASLALLSVAGLSILLAWRRWHGVERAMRTGQPLPGFGGPTIIAAVLGLLVVSVAVGVIVVASQ